MLRRSACGMKRNVFAAACARPSAGYNIAASAISAAASLVAAAITGIIPLRVLFSGATLRDPAGHAKAPGVAGRHASRVPDAQKAPRPQCGRGWPRASARGRVRVFPWQTPSPGSPSRLATLSRDAGEGLLLCRLIHEAVELGGVVADDLLADGVGQVAELL